MKRSTLFVAMMAAGLYSSNSLAVDFFMKSDSDGRSIQSVQSQKVNPELFNQIAGTEINLSLPDGAKKFIISDMTSSSDEARSENTMVGYVVGESPDTKTIIVNKDGVVYGKLVSNGVEYEIDSSSETPFKVVEPFVEPQGDNDEANTITTSTGKSLPLSVQNVLIEQADATTDVATVNVMIVYSNEYAAKLGGSLPGKLSYLIEMSNQAYKDSGVNIKLNLVKTMGVDYPESNSTSGALSPFKNSQGAFSNVSNTRWSSGADIVVFYRGYDGSNTCGVGYVTGQGMKGTVANDAAYAYSVVSAGYIGGVGCSDLTFTHEVGHNMGLTHDQANSSFPGVFAYSYGYGVPGQFGSVMSYISPRVGKFSSPLTQCASTYTCGVANQADNSRSLNATRFEVAGFMSGGSNNPTPTPPPTVVSAAVVVNVVGGGTVVSSDGKINCGTTCTGTYTDSTASITLTATPKENYKFVGWSGNCTGTGTCTVSTSASKNVTATFEYVTPARYAVSVTKAGGNGTVNSSDGFIICGSRCSTTYGKGGSVTLTAIPDFSNKFNGWGGACKSSGMSTSCTINNITEAKSVTANFLLVTPTFDVTVKKPTNATIITKDGKIKCGGSSSTCTATYDKGTVVTFQGLPDAGYAISSWVGSCTGTFDTCKQTITANISVGLYIKKK